MSKKTTTKPIALGYRAVGSHGDFNRVMGVLKGLAVSQDEADATDVESEFYDSPFDIFYDGSPVTLTFELANYELDELSDLFGGEYDDTNDEYEGATTAFTTEYEWKLDFGRGYAALIMYRGLTVGTIKKDADGALNFSVTITALVLTDDNGIDHLYAISQGLPPYYGVNLGLPSGTLWANMNIGAESPSESGKYYQWGETVGYYADQLVDQGGTAVFTSSTYKYRNNSKYNATDKLEVLVPMDDAATTEWGSSWHIPTSQDVQELLDNTYQNWQDDYDGTGVSGYLFVSRINGNSIFIPAAGYASGTSIHGTPDDSEAMMHVWSSNVGNTGNAYYLFGLEEEADLLTEQRYYGHNIRPVTKAPVNPQEEPLLSLSVDSTKDAWCAEGHTYFNTVYIMLHSPVTSSMRLYDADGNEFSVSLSGENVSIEYEGRTGTGSNTAGTKIALSVGSSFKFSHRNIRQIMSNGRPVLWEEYDGLFRTFNFAGIEAAGFPPTTTEVVQDGSTSVTLAALEYNGVEYNIHSKKVDDRNTDYFLSDVQTTLEQSWKHLQSIMKIDYFDIDQGETFVGYHNWQILKNRYGIPATIWERGDIVASVWADQACTQRPTGYPSSVFLKIHRDITEDMTWGDYDTESSSLVIENNDGLWEITLWVDLMLTGLSSLPAGVYEIQNPVEVDVTGFDCNFYIDGTSD